MLMLVVVAGLLYAAAVWVDLRVARRVARDVQDTPVL